VAKLWNILERWRDAALGAGAISRWSQQVSWPFEGLIVRGDPFWPTDLHSEWKELSRRVLDSTIFVDSPWQWFAIMGTTPLTRSRFISVWKADQMLAVLPLAMNPSGVLASPIAAISDYLDPLVDPQDEQTSWQAIVAFLITQWDRKVAEVVFHNVREAASVRTVLPPIARAAGLACEEQVVEQAPAIALPETWEAYLASLDARDRKELRRKINKAETQGAAKLEKPERDKADAALARALDLMEAAGGEKAEA